MQHECTHTTTPVYPMEEMTHLRDELGNSPDIIQRTLRISVAHNPRHEIQTSKLARVVIPYTPTHPSVSHTKIIIKATPNHSPFCDPGTACKSKLTLIPYFLAHPITLKIYSQHTFCKNGSLSSGPLGAFTLPTSSHFSIAQNGMGRRTQLRPAPAI